MASSPTVPPIPPSFHHDYAAAWSPTPPSQLSLVDMRAQILANASILLPLLSDPSITRDVLEITTARFIPRASNGREYRYYAMLVRRPRQLPIAADMAGRPIVPGPQRLTVLVKGKPLDSEMAALAWMLNETEERMHGLAGTKQAVTEESCGVM